MFRRSFLRVGDRQVHYRTAGSGPPVVMLHPSPLSSQAVLPVATEIARHCQVFALDTPGYGLSESLPEKPASLEPFLQPLAATLDALGIQRCCLYGAATGAQIGLEFAASHPQRVALLVMDTAGHIPAAVCERLVDGYFPDVSPRHDGAHLMTLWGLVRDLGVFFPWNDLRQQARIPRDLPPAAALQVMLLDYLRAGSRYDWAYRPAFYNERAERVLRCRVPAILTRWPSSIALAITDALIAAGLPDNFRVLDLGPTMSDRACGIAEAIASEWTGGPAQQPAVCPPWPDRFSSAMLDAGEFQLHARIVPAGDERPLVALHRAGASARLMEGLLTSLALKRPLVAIDLPGHGDSDASNERIAVHAEAVRAALDSLAMGDADLLGDGIGAAVAAQLRSMQPSRFRSLAAIDRALPAAESVPWPALTPCLDGTHLLEAWYMLRDRRLWRPWHLRTVAAIRDDGDPDLGPGSLHEELVELLKCGEGFAALARVEAGLDPATLPGFQCGPALLLGECCGSGTSAAVPVSANTTAIRRWLDA